jgi:hypothetical protein
MYWVISDPALGWFQNQSNSIIQRENSYEHSARKKTRERRMNIVDTDLPLPMIGCIEAKC